MDNQAPNPAYAAQQMPQGYAPQGYAPQGYAPQGYAPQGYAPQGYPQQQPMMMAPGQQPMMMVPQSGGMMPQPGMVMVPAGYNVNIVPVLAPDLMSSLGRLKGLMIKQKIELLEVLSGCETKNRYHASAWDPQLGADKPKAGQGEEFFKYKEESDCCIRLLCGSFRPFKMAMFASSDKIGTFRKGGDPLTYPDAVVLERPFRCTCLCLWRPIIKVRHVSMGYIGEIYNPFAVFSREFVIRPPTDDGYLEGPIAESVRTMAHKDWYRISGTICQPAMWCFLPCGDCAKVTFEIYAGDDIGKTKPIGYIARVWPGCAKTLLSDADNYVISFPDNATPVQKAALSAVPILIDFLYFENNNQNEGGNGGGLISALLS